MFKYGQTYARGTEEAISQSKNNYSTHAADQENLRQTVLSKQPLTGLKSGQSKDTSHPGVNMRYVLSLGKHFSKFFLFFFALIFE